MNYKEKYEKALERAREYWEIDNDNTLDIKAKGTMEHLFPELAELEEKKILKELVSIVKSYRESCITEGNHRFDDCLAWLEKLKVFAEHGEGLYYFTNSEFTYAGKPYSSVSVSQDNGVDIIFDKKPVKHISDEKQGQKKYTDDLTQQEAMDIAVAKCFEQGGQKPVDKVEPKLHIGDWVVDEDDNNIYQIENVIENVTNGKFSHDLVGGGYFPSTKKNYHLWTIQDAKDGDVLAAKECYVIFKEVDGLNIKCHCTYHYLGFNTSFHINTLQNKTAFQPATKEQRDALMKAMADAGYTFDFEKKELKKFERKPAEWKQENVEELSDFENAMMHIGGSFFGENAGLDPNDTDTIKEQAELLLELAPKTEWSEEDEEMVEGLNNCFDELEKENGWCYIYVNDKNVKLNKVRNWVKSLKQRIGG